MEELLQGRNSITELLSFRILSTGNMMSMAQKEASLILVIRITTHIKIILIEMRVTHSTR